jgi:hypothetical protein
MTTIEQKCGVKSFVLIVTIYLNLPITEKTFSILGVAYILLKKC